VLWVCRWCITLGCGQPVSWMDEGLASRAGVAHACRASRIMANCMVDAARGVLNSLLADVYIFHRPPVRPRGGLSPGTAFPWSGNDLGVLSDGRRVAKGRAVDVDEEGEEGREGRGGGRGVGRGKGEGEGRRVALVRRIWGCVLRSAFWRRSAGEVSGLVSPGELALV